MQHDLSYLSGTYQPRLPPPCFLSKTIESHQHEQQPIKRLPHVPTAGIVAGRALLNENPASFAFMVLITDGESSTDPASAAQETRADNTTTIFAVGVGMTRLLVVALQIQIQQISSRKMW